MNTKINELQKETTEKGNKKRNQIKYNTSNKYYYILSKWNESSICSNWSKSTKYNFNQHMKYFLLYLEENNITNLLSLNKNHVLDYIKQRPIKNNITAKHEYYIIKIILKFLFNNNYITHDLAIYVPNIKIPKNSSIPSSWNKEELKKILMGVNLNLPTGKRLYLALTLAIIYGLRNSDIKKLKFSNFDWENKKINITQRKTGKQINLPMTNEFISAFIDYVKNERPKSNNDIVLLKRNGQPLCESYNFHKEIKIIVKKQQLSCNNRKIGIHSMRHTLANNLLKENIPLPIISSILGHSSTSVTTIYLKNDKSQLKKCCLSLEEVKIQ